MRGGGSVDGAIHKAVGEKVLAECLKIKPNPNRFNSGEAVITSGFELVKYLIHTVGSIWIYGKSNEA
ncbi:macro domain-containing protein [Peptostreptococcaceae bacterium AGR-M142]